MRVHLAALAGLSIGLALLGAGDARSQSIVKGGISIRLQQFGAVSFGTSFLGIPTDLAPLNDGTGRLVVQTIGGTARLVSSTGQLLDGGTYFNSPRTGGFGSLSVVAHPNFAVNGLLYQLVDKSFTGTADYGIGIDHENVLIEWKADNPASNSPTFTSRELLRVAQPDSEHNVFDLDFGPDGFLYVSSGDGGPATLNPNAAPRARTQSLSEIYGKILRIDPLNLSGPGLITSRNGNYGIPTSNIGHDGDVNSGTLEEVYALGLRSPFRMNFDDVTGRLYVGDVGERYFEEINVVEAGRNYGWGRFEGTLERGSVPLAPQSPVHTPPAFAYERDGAPYDPVTGAPTTDDVGDGDTVIGGFVYRGSLLPDLVGKYVFADFGRQRGSDQNGSPARFFYGDLDASGDVIDSSVREFRIDLAGEPLAIPSADPQLPNGASNSFIYSIGQDGNGELYLLLADDGNRAVNRTNRVVQVLAGLFTTPDLLGDLDFDRALTPADWLLFKSGIDLDLSALTSLGKYQKGDLNADGVNDVDDFGLFKTAYNAANGPGSFEAVIGVPEPSTLIMAMAVTAFGMIAIRRGAGKDDR